MKQKEKTWYDLFDITTINVFKKEALNTGYMFISEKYINEYLSIKENKDDFDKAGLDTCGRERFYTWLQCKLTNDDIAFIEDKEEIELNEKKYKEALLNDDNIHRLSERDWKKHSWEIIDMLCDLSILTFLEDKSPKDFDLTKMNVTISEDCIGLRCLVNSVVLNNDKEFIFQFSGGVQLPLSVLKCNVETQLRIYNSLLNVPPTIWNV